MKFQNICSPRILKKTLSKPFSKNIHLFKLIADIMSLLYVTHYVIYMYLYIIYMFRNS